MFDGMVSDRAIMFRLTLKGFSNQFEIDRLPLVSSSFAAPFLVRGCNTSPFSAGVTAHVQSRHPSILLVCQFSF